MACGNSNQPSERGAAPGAATAGPPRAGGGSEPVVFRATEEQLRDGLGRIAPGLDETTRAHMAATMKASNDQMMNRQPRPATFQPTAHPPPRVVNEHLINLQRPTRVGRWWSFVRAVIPWWFGLRPSKKVIAARQEACLRGGPDKTPCEFIVQQGLFMGCGACGCPARPTSDLGNRVRMPFDRCAMGNWPGQTPVIPRKEPTPETPSGNGNGKVPTQTQSPPAPDSQASPSPTRGMVQLVASRASVLALGYYDRLRAIGFEVHWASSPNPNDPSGPVILYGTENEVLEGPEVIERFIARAAFGGEASPMVHGDGRATPAASLAAR